MAQPSLGKGFSWALPHMLGWDWRPASQKVPALCYSLVGLFPYGRTDGRLRRREAAGPRRDLETLGRAQMLSWQWQWRLSCTLVIQPQPSGGGGCRKPRRPWDTASSAPIWMPSVVNIGCHLRGVACFCGSVSEAFVTEITDGTRSQKGGNGRC